MTFVSHEKIDRTIPVSTVDIIMTTYLVFQSLDEQPRIHFAEFEDLGPGTSILSGKKNTEPAGTTEHGTTHYTPFFTSNFCGTVLES